MTESEYKHLSQFQNLPLYDENDPRSDTFDEPEKEDPGRATWLRVHEATTLKSAQDDLADSRLVPKGGVRYWESNRMEFEVFAYFWEKK
jgi:hypothetical protein